MSKNNYHGVSVTKQAGFLVVKKNDIPQGVDYPKRFAARAIANRLGVTEDKVYTDPTFARFTDNKGNQRYQCVAR